MDLFRCNSSRRGLALPVMRGNPGRIHREFLLDLPRPRKRTEYHLQRWKEQLLAELDLSLGSLIK